jgi:hypothetical protein
MGGNLDLEPSIEELLEDPVAQLLMARDGVDPDWLRRMLGEVRDSLHAEERE